MRPSETASPHVSSGEKHAGSRLNVPLSTYFNSEAFKLYLVKQSDGPTKLFDAYWSLRMMCKEQGVRR